MLSYGRMLLLLLLLHLSVRSVYANSEVIDSNNLSRLSLLYQWNPSTDSFVAATFNSHYDTLALALGDNKIKLLSVPELNEIGIIEYSGVEPTSLRFNENDTTLLLSFFDRSYMWWNTSDKTLIGYHQLSNQDLSSTTSADISTLAILRTDKTIDIINMATNEKALTLNQFIDAKDISHIRLNGNGSLLLLLVDGTLILWDINTLTTLSRIDAFDGYRVNGFDFINNDTEIWFNRETNNHLLEYQSENVFFDFRNHLITYRQDTTGSHNRILYSPSDNLFATFGYSLTQIDKVWVWDKTKNSVIGEAGIPTGGGVAAFNRNQDILAVGGGTSPTLDFWSRVKPNYSSIYSLQTDSGMFATPQFTADGTLLLTVSSNVKLWIIK